MAWPPPTLPTNRTNATPQHDSHAADHNAANLAINDLVAMVASLITSVGRYGFTAIQGGQAVAAGATVELAWSGVSDAAWGGGPVFTVPAGQGGVYVGVLEVTGPEPPVNAHADIVLCMAGVLYVDYIPESKARSTVTAARVMTPGEQLYTQVYNPLGSSQFFSASLIIVRVAV